MDATLIIGLGNPLRGDDGIGVRVAQALAKQKLPPGVEVLDGGTQGLGIVNLLEGRQRVIFVDAADVGAAPGQFRRFTLDEARLPGNDHHLSLHNANLRDALLLAQALDMLPSEVIIFGVQPDSLQWKASLSPAVETALPQLLEAISSQLKAKS